MKNNSEVRTMLKEAMILFVITLLSGLLLGFVYELTKEPRRLQQEKTIREACEKVFPSAKEQGISLSFTETGYIPDGAVLSELAGEGVEIGTVYEALNGSQRYGCVVEAVSSKGYGGDIVLYVGVTADGTVSGVSITEISETPGLGMEAPTVLIPQFAGKSVESFTYVKGGGASAENEVDAISGATVTTKAVTNAVNGGLRVALELLGGGDGNE